jgi:hypothetical protein
MAELPDIDQIERAILDEIYKKNIRGRQIFDIMSINIQLQSNGFTGSEITSAFQSMKNKGWIENSKSIKFFMLTDAGFAAI